MFFIFYQPQQVTAYHARLLFVPIQLIILFIIYSSPAKTLFFLAFSKAEKSLPIPHPRHNVIFPR